jgi:hypothetical protein
MPTEFRFDDLDLREEPVTSESKSGEMDGTSICTEPCTGSSCHC